jgi:hypothetical protein
VSQHDTDKYDYFELCHSLKLCHCLAGAVFPDSGIWHLVQCCFLAVLAFYFLGFLSFCFRLGLFCLWLMVSFSLYSLGFFAACVEAGVVTLLLLGFLGYFYAFVFV